MPYQTNLKLGYGRTLRNVQPGQKVGFNPLTTVDAVYGYRSQMKEGAGTEAMERYNPPQGSLVEKLRYRRDFLERQVSAQMQDSGTSSFLTEDRGHPFSVSHTRVSFHSARMKYPGYGIDQDVLLPLSRQFKYTRANGTVGYTTALASLLPLSWSGAGLSNQLKSTAAVLDASTLRAMGTNYIAKTYPNTPLAQGAVAALELLQPGGIPTLARGLRRTIMDVATSKHHYGVRDYASLTKKFAKEGGSSYLELMFGWMPLISDVKAFADALALLDGLIFDGESTRRSRKTSWKTLQGSTRETVAAGFNSPLYTSRAKPWVQSVSGPWNGTSYTCNMEADYSVNIGYNVRFKGRFSKPARPDARFNGYLDRYYHFLGLEITPEVLWELTSWSWLLDWFTDLGGVAQNLSAWQTSGYRCDYAYATLAVQATFSAMAVNAVPAPGLIVEGLPFTIANKVEKYRMPASPFGFNVDTSGLNSTQWSILTALGLARSR